VGYHHDATTLRLADGKVTIFTFRVVRIEDRDAERVSEDRGGFLKANAVLSKVRFSFP